MVNFKNPFIIYFVCISFWKNTQVNPPLHKKLGIWRGGTRSRIVVLEVVAKCSLLLSDDKYLAQISKLRQARAAALPPSACAAARVARA